MNDVLEKEIERIAEKTGLMLCGKELQDSINNREILLKSVLSELAEFVVTQAAEVARDGGAPNAASKILSLVEVKR